MCVHIQLSNMYLAYRLLSVLTKLFYYTLTTKTQV